MKLYAFGDSFVAGDQDLENQNFDYLKYNVSFVSLIAKKWNIDLVNCAEPGTSNYAQLDLLTHKLKEKQITSNDIVLFGITSTSRDRTSLLTADNKHISVINQGVVGDQWELLCEIDQIYVLSILDKLSELYQVRILKFNLFYNALPAGELLFNDYYNKGTLVDIINDTWDKNLTYPIYHGNLNVPANYKKYYTKNLHPSVEGHQKIADWIISNIQL